MAEIYTIAGGDRMFSLYLRDRINWRCRPPVHFGRVLFTSRRTPAGTGGSFIVLSAMAFGGNGLEHMFGLSFSRHLIAPSGWASTDRKFSGHLFPSELRLKQRGLCRFWRCALGSGRAVVFALLPWPEIGGVGNMPQRCSWVRSPSFYYFRFEEPSTTGRSRSGMRCAM